MFPELFKIPFLNLPVHTYGALYVLGLMVGLFVAYRQALLGRKYYDDVLDFGFWVLLGALIGARVLFVIVEKDYYFHENPYTYLPVLGFSIPTFLAVWKGGFVFWGGAIGGIIALIVFCKKRKINPWIMADLCALGLPLGHAIGRIGCIAGGCCFGKTDYHLDSAGEVVPNFMFDISFPKGSIAYNSLYDGADSALMRIMDKLGTTLPLFPVQLLEALGNVGIFLILMAFTPLKRAHGQVGMLYMILYSIMRATTEMFRGDSARGFVIDGILSTSQFISAVMALVGLIIMIKLSKKRVEL